MNDYNLDELQKFLKTVPDMPKRGKTFLEIANFPNRENVWSNIYAFFLDKDEEHDLGDLFLRSLLEVVKDKYGQEIKIFDYQVFTEKKTDQNNKIDILIIGQDNSSAIIIENKVHHYLDNPLNDYRIFAEKLCANSNNIIGLVLTLHKLSEKDDLKKMEINKFLNITHKQWIDTVLKNLGKNLQNVNDKYLIFLKDFIKHIYNYYQYQENMEEYIKFFFDKENRKKIDSILEIQEMADKYKQDSINEAFDRLNGEFKDKYAIKSNSSEFIVDNDKFRIEVSFLNQKMTIFKEGEGKELKSVNLVEDIIMDLSTVIVNTLRECMVVKT